MTTYPAVPRRWDGCDLSGTKRCTLSEATLDTGFVDLDRTLGPLRPGTLTVAAAAPGHGIQAFMLGVAQHVAARQRRPVAILTTGPSRDELAGRLACEASGDCYPPPHRIEQERPLLANHAAVLLHMLPVTITETSDNLADLIATAHWLHAHRPFDMLLIFGPPEAMSAARCAADYNYCGDLKAPIDMVLGLRDLAGELEVPVLLQSDVAHRTSRREQPLPLLSDLPALGFISRHYDASILLWSDLRGVSPVPGWSPAEITVAHNRHGMVGRVTLGFSGTRGRFENLPWPAWPDTDPADDPPF